MVVEKTIILLNKLLENKVIQDEDIDTDVKLYLRGLNGFKKSHAIIKLKGKEFEVYENSDEDLLYKEVAKALGVDINENDVTVKSNENDYEVSEALGDFEKYAIYYKPTGEFVTYNDKSGKRVLFTQDETLIKEALFNILFTDGGYDGDDSDFEIRIVNASTDGSEYIKDDNMFVSPKETY